MKHCSRGRMCTQWHWHVVWPFVGAAMIPAGLFPWEELNKTESSSQFISHRSNLGGLEWNLQIGGIARGLGAWQVLVLNQFQLLSAAVTVIFFSTLDWMANGGGIEALLLGYCGHLLSCKYRESGSHKSSYLWDSWFSGRDRTLGNCHPRS